MSSTSSKSHDSAQDPGRGGEAGRGEPADAGEARLDRGETPRADRSHANAPGGDPHRRPHPAGQSPGLRRRARQTPRGVPPPGPDLLADDRRRGPFQELQRHVRASGRRRSAAERGEGAPPQDAAKPTWWPATAARSLRSSIRARAWPTPASRPCGPARRWRRASSSTTAIVFALPSVSAWRRCWATRTPAKRSSGPTAPCMPPKKRAATASIFMTARIYCRVVANQETALASAGVQPPIRPVPGEHEENEKARPARDAGVRTRADGIAEPESLLDLPGRTRFCQQVRNRMAEWKRGGPAFSVALIEVEPAWRARGRIAGQSARELARGRPPGISWQRSAKWMCWAATRPTASP